MFRKTMTVEPQTARSIKPALRQLTAAELALVSGGINPQPLPPSERNLLRM